MEFVFEGRGKAERTGHERIAMRNIKWAFNNIVGGYYNDYQDDNIEYLPKSREELANTIYDAAMNDLYGDGFCRCGGAPTEMRFAGEKFCRAYIEWKLDNDGDVEVIAEAANWNKPIQSGNSLEESEETTMNNKERFLTMLADIIESGKLNPIEKYYNQTDWYLGNEIWNLIPQGFCLAPYEMKELSDKPALVQRMEFINALHQNHTVYRITKAGWQRVEELRAIMPKEEPKPVEVKDEYPGFEIRTEKLQKILDYVPWCKADAIHACWKDADGYWIILNDGWNANRMNENCHTIHEKTLYDLRYQIGGIKKVG